MKGQITVPRLSEPIKMSSENINSLDVPIHWYKGEKYTGEVAGTANNEQGELFISVSDIEDGLMTRTTYYKKTESRLVKKYVCTYKHGVLNGVCIVFCPDELAAAIILMEMGHRAGNIKLSDCLDHQFSIPTLL